MLLLFESLRVLWQTFRASLSLMAVIGSDHSRFRTCSLRQVRAARAARQLVREWHTKTEKNARMQSTKYLKVFQVQEMTLVEKF